VRAVAGQTQVEKGKGIKETSWSIIGSSIHCLMVRLAQMMPLYHTSGVHGKAAILT
jgi:hypothetical protein